jgi:hypothetical protein
MITREELKIQQEANQARTQKARIERRRTKDEIAKAKQIRQDSIAATRKSDEPSGKTKSGKSLKR